MMKHTKEEAFSPEDWLRLTVATAMQLGASDIHIEPLYERLLIRFRVDGVLRVISEMPRDRADLIIARIKIEGQMDSTDRRTPQEGHALIELPSEEVKQVDVRISIFPTIYGETAVLRILNRGQTKYASFSDLGMNEEQVKIFEDIMRMPFGMVLATGPTGSGKTTALYTAIERLEAPERNIMTLEDPVERQFSTVRQSQVNPSVGVTFASGLRSILRQDPDIVMIGEIRDVETAEIASRAAMTGRLLLSTLHTKDTFGAIMRLIDFDIPRSVIASSLRLVVNSRLVRRVCDACADADAPQQYLYEEAAKTMDVSSGKFIRGVGCDVCGNSGYRGRVGVFEVLRVDENVERGIVEQMSIHDLRQASINSGMHTLRRDALVKAVAGQITLEDAIRTTAL